MKHSRRAFVKTSAALSLLPLISVVPNADAQPLMLSFSTLGCPDWSFDQILDFAVAHHYKALEIRGIMRQLDLPQCPEFSTPEKIRESRKKIADKGLRTINLGSSSNMHLPQGEARKKSFDDAKRFIDLAVQLDCPYIRVYPNSLPKDEDKQKVIERIVNGLQTVSDLAKGTNVTVLMETHGDVVYKDDLLNIMKMTDRKNIALIWDIVNMWSVTKEPPAEVYKALKPYVRHTHIKDGRLKDGKVQYTFLGEGEMPIFDAIDILRKDNYKGYFSFEWEKLWHPEIAEPEPALSSYAQVMTTRYGK